MGAYRDQLLRETYGNKPINFYEENEESPTSFFTVFKLKFTICLFSNFSNNGIRINIIK